MMQPDTQIAREVGLVDTYVQYIGEREPDNRHVLDALSPTNTMHAAISIGHACAELSWGSDRAALAILRTARDSLGTTLGAPNMPHTVRQEAINLRNLAKLILGRETPGAVTNFREATYRAAISGLRQDAKELRDLPHFDRYGYEQDEQLDHAIGRSAQNRILALLARTGTSFTLPVASLPHHDEGPKHENNFDILLIEQGWDIKQAPEAHKLQAKHCCLGFCGNRGVEEIAQHILSRYDEETILVSSHCDTAVDKRLKGASVTNRLLNDERDGRASVHERQLLDKLTERLLADICHNPWSNNRRGTRKAKPLRPYELKLLNLRGIHNDRPLVAGRLAA